jgi:hypothetical protein
LRAGSGSAPSTRDGGTSADCAFAACGTKRGADVSTAITAIGERRKIITGIEGLRSLSGFQHRHSRTPMVKSCILVQ